MELPLALRRAVDQALDGVALSEIAAAAADLSRRYREELRDGQLHVATDRAVLAYLAVRLPRPMRRSARASRRSSLSARILHRRPLSTPAPDRAPRYGRRPTAGPI